ncbi:hypothetical protein [Psychroserpens mesophilus]|uniref:hypothetical protein n=1 Tax=Psychroserpens mesophilus TaxID=325473 RepID=UPI003D659BCB
MITGIVIIVLIVIGKFIYDSYLTNNTEKRWEEHKNMNSINVPETKITYNDIKPFNNVRIDGYYVHNYKGLDIYNNSFEIIQLLLFLDDKYVCLIEPESYLVTTDERMKVFMSKLKESIKIIKSDEYNHLDDSLGTYQVDNNKIEIKFFNPKDENNSDINNPKVYKKLYGSIQKDKLVLNQLDRIYDYSIGNFREAEIELLKGSKFIYSSL